MILKTLTVPRYIRTSKGKEAFSLPGLEAQVYNCSLSTVSILVLKEGQEQEFPGLFTVTCRSDAIRLRWKHGGVKRWTANERRPGPPVTLRWLIKLCLVKEGWDEVTTTPFQFTTMPESRNPVPSVGIEYPSENPIEQLHHPAPLNIFESTIKDPCARNIVDCGENRSIDAPLVPYDSSCASLSSALSLVTTVHRLDSSLEDDTWTEFADASSLQVAAHKNKRAKRCDSPLPTLPVISTNSREALKEMDMEFDRSVLRAVQAIADQSRNKLATNSRRLVVKRLLSRIKQVFSPLPEDEIWTEPAEKQLRYLMGNFSMDYIMSRLQEKMDLKNELRRPNEPFVSFDNPGVWEFDHITSLGEIARFGYTMDDILFVCQIRNILIVYGPENKAKASTPFFAANAQQEVNERAQRMFRSLT